MGSYNRIILVGNLTRDPESRSLASGDPIARFSIAVSRKTKNGEETTFVDITAFRKTAEICMQYLKKGMCVLVEGRLSIRSYEDKDGNQRKGTEVICDGMQMLDKKKDGEYSSGSASSYGRGGGSSSGDFGDLDEEVPF